MFSIYATFRVYPNDIEGVKGYYDFIGYKRYENLHFAKDYRQYAEYIKKDGWATSSEYRDNLIGKVEKYNLQRFDLPLSNPTFIMGKTYKTNANLKIRKSPNGERVMFEDITEDAKKHSFSNEEGFAVLKEGTKVTCKGITDLDGDIWVKIPSGYIAGYVGKKYYLDC